MNIFLLLVSLLPYFVSSAAAAVSAAVSAPLSSNKNANAKAGGVYELTSVTLDANIRDGSLWLVEFYAPWCRHCSTFAPTYDQLAHSIHSGNSGRERPIKLAKVNGDKERASTSRFNIQGYPMFFVVDGWKVYQYDGARSEDALKTFVVRDGYKAQNVSYQLLSISKSKMIMGMYTHVYLLPCLDQDSNTQLSISHYTIPATPHLVISHGPTGPNSSNGVLGWKFVLCLLLLPYRKSRILTGLCGLSLCLWRYVYGTRDHGRRGDHVEWKNERRLRKERL